MGETAAGLTDRSEPGMKTKPTEAVESAMLDAYTVAQMLNVKVTTIYAAAKNGKLPHVVLWRGQRRPLLRFRRTDIERLINGPTLSE
jgi:excisionase family DNA binding protein